MQVVDYMTGAKGSYGIERQDERGFRSFWNPSGWAGSGYVFTDKKLADAVLELLQRVHPENIPNRPLRCAA
jgi:hypothetical protein